MTQMTDPYRSLGLHLAAAAERRETGHRGSWSPRVRRVPAVAIAAALVLASGVAAVAATGLLEGSPVKPEVNPSAVRENGLPVAREGSGPLIRTADPSGGLPWGMRVLHTTRGQVCVQVGRVEGNRLGELGADSAFGDDGRFHALAADVLPPGYGGSSAQAECLPSGRTLISEDGDADRNAVRLLPQEFPERPGGAQVIPPRSHLRMLAYGLLGPHAVSVTFRTPTGLQTERVSGPEGAFLIVEPGGAIKSVESPSRVGSSMWGEASPRSVEVTGQLSAKDGSIVTGVTFRFGARLCSQGAGGPVHAKCPAPPPQRARPTVAPARNLHQTIRLALLRQSPAACRSAYLLDPCYKGQLEFEAPYAVSSASTDYDIQSFANCDAGGRPESGWGLERDVNAHETIRTTSLGLFTLAPRCLAHEGFEVRYGQTFGAPEPPRAPVILGTVKLSEATIPSKG